MARVRPLEEDEGRGRAIDARFRALRERAQEVLELAPGAPEDLAQAVAGIESPNQLAYLVAPFMAAPTAHHLHHHHRHHHFMHTVL